MINELSIRTVFNKLKDDESRRIYNARLLFSLTGDESYMINILQDYNEKIFSTESWKQFVQKIKNDSHPKYIFGCGEFGKRLYSNTKDIIKWNGFIDNSVKQPIKNKDIVIYPFNQKAFETEANFYLPSKAFYYEMYNQLLEKGVNPSNIIDATIIYDITEGMQYFDLKELPHQDKEVFVDCGACDGMSSISFIKWANSSEYDLICYEPDEININKIKNNFASRDIINYKIINKGLWSNNTILNFCSIGNANSYICEDNITDQNIIQLEVTTLDDSLKDTPVSFIKMDIEGSELEAIKGARNIIKKHKPKLAICIYHKEEDIWEIPSAILDIRDDYVFYIRHYSYNQHETVLYAI